MSYTALAKYIGKIHKVRYFMPPFAGTPKEAQALAAFIAGDLNGKDVSEPKPSNAGNNSGKMLFEENCSSCHELADLAEKTAGWEQQKIRTALDKLNQLVKEMPPYDGTFAEKDQLVAFLYSLNHKEAVQPVVPSVDGKRVFEDHCSPCHASSDLAEKTAAWDRAKIRDALDKLNQLVEEMPPMEGTKAEKEDLADYLNSLKGGQK